MATRKVQTEDDVWSRVAVVGDTSSCWLWQGKTKPRIYRGSVRRYPVIRFNGRQYQVRRWVAEHYPVTSRAQRAAITLPVDSTFYVSNTCGNSLCVRPDHLLIEDTQSWRQKPAA